MKAGFGERGTETGLAELRANGVEMSLGDQGVSEGADFSGHRGLDHGEDGAKADGTAVIGVGDHPFEDVHRSPGKGAEFVTDEVGVDLLGLFESEAEMGLGAAPVVNGGAMESGGAGRGGDGGALNQGSDDALLDGRGFGDFDFDRHGVLLEKRKHEDSNCGREKAWKRLRRNEKKNFDRA